jgi:hypothetical protein
MANKLRSINTKFWNDPYVEELNPSEKLLFLYCLSSPHSNLLGIYEISLKKISFETGLNQETIRKAFERFGNDSKVFYKGNYIIIPNFLNHQRLNANMKIGIVNIFHDLPEWLKTEVLGNGSEGLGNDSKAFESIRNGLLKKEEGKRKKERGKRKKEEGNMKGEKSKFTPPTLSEIKKYFSENGYTEEAAEKAFNYYHTANWYDSRGNKIKNWKQKMHGVWFKEENKQKNKQKSAFDNF